MGILRLSQLRRRWKRREKVRRLRKKWLKARSQGEKDAIAAKLRRISPDAPLPDTQGK